MMYELLCEYAKRFGTDFPISAVMKDSNENGVVQMVQKCLMENKPYTAEKETVEDTKEIEETVEDTKEIEETEKTEETKKSKK